jgi:hypothetical protein
MVSKSEKLKFSVSWKGQILVQLEWKLCKSQMALTYPGLAVSLKFQKSNENYRRLEWSWSSVTIFQEFDEDLASRSLILLLGVIFIFILSLFPLFSWLRLNWCTSLFKTEQEPRAVLVAWALSLNLYSFNENPANRRFVEEQHEIRSPEWSGKTTDGLVSPLDCPKIAKMDVLWRRLIYIYHASSMWIWNLVSNVLSGSIFIFNLHVHGIMHTVV